MAAVTLRIPAPLRPLAGGADEVLVRAGTVGEALHRGLDRAVIERILTPEGEIRRFVNLYLGQENVDTQEGLDTPVHDGDVLAIVPAVAGGGDRAIDATWRACGALAPG